MKIAYFDCFAGVSGDMILGALIDAGLKKENLLGELRKLKIEGYNISVKKTMRKGVAATRVSVNISGPVRTRNLRSIIRLINQSNLDSEVKDLSSRAFNRLAAAEGKIHGSSKEEVHFHEVGGTDAIIDIVGAYIGMKRLGVTAVYSSKLHIGSGLVKCRQGVLPIPAPATMQLLKGIPIYSTDLESELVTPTGACILRNCAQGFGAMPPMRVQRIGYGAGVRRLPIPNLLRVYVGEDTLLPACERDEVILLEANIDDLAPEILAYVCELLRTQGALDVYLRPIYMKKNRVGSLLSALVAEDKLEQAISTIFTETTTLGIRVSRLQRYKLRREVISLKTRFGKIKAKLARRGKQVISVLPEYESCRKAAHSQGIPLQVVYQATKDSADKIWRKKR